MSSRDHDRDRDRHRDSRDYDRDRRDRYDDRDRDHRRDRYDDRDRRDRDYDRDRRRDRSRSPDDRHRSSRRDRSRSPNDRYRSSRRDRSRSTDDRRRSCDKEAGAKREREEEKERVPPQRAPPALKTGDEDGPSSSVFTSVKAEDLDPEEVKRRRLEKLQGWKAKTGFTGEDVPPPPSSSTEAAAQQPTSRLTEPTPAAPVAPAAAVEDEDEDPLDAFMREQSAQHAAAVAKSLAMGQQEIKTDVKLEDTSALEAAEAKKLESFKHCYICKKNGHTKGDCPMRRCNLCPGETGHSFMECPKKGTKEDPLIIEQKKKKVEAAKEAKRRKRAREAEEHLRSQAGVQGYKALYRLLNLPINRLASEADIKRQFRALSLEYHPDKHQDKTEEELEEIQTKFIDIKTAYDLLIEGIQTGGKNMKGAVFKAGELTTGKGEDAGEQVVVPEEEA